MEIPENSLDNFIDEGLKQADETLKQLEQGSVLVHKVFCQNPDGRELLTQWKHSMVMLPTVEPNSTQFEAGINEGIKKFVRNLIVQIETIETSGDKHE